MDIYQQERVQTLRLILEEYQVIEYETCLKTIYNNIRNGRKYTKFHVSLNKVRCPEWDTKIAAFHIMEKLRADDLDVYYRSPNILYIIHNKCSNVTDPKKIKIYEIMKKENTKTISWLQNSNRKPNRNGQKRKFL